MPTTLLFDLDNTLIDDDASLYSCVRKVCDELVAHLPPFDADVLARQYISRSDRFWAERPYDAASLPQARLQFWSEVLSAFDCDDPAVALMSRDAYASYRFEFAEAYDETRDVLEHLHGRYRLAVITNGIGEQQRARLRHSDLDKYFEAVIAPADVDAGKPEAVIFEHTLRLLGTSPAESWHIGDSLNADVQGAHNARLGAGVWLNRRGLSRTDNDPIPHHEVTDLREFAALLERYAS